MTNNNKTTSPSAGGGACSIDGSPIECKRSTLSKSRADQLFKELAGEPNIPFDYPDDCCYTRANRMCGIMQKEGIQCGKVWNYSHDYPIDSLRVTTSNNPKGYVTWKYHVAPVVDVQGDDGATRVMVLDPSTFDHPVTVDEWVKNQGDLNPSGVHEPPYVLTDPSYYFRDLDGTKDPNPSEADVEETLATHRNKRDLRKLSK